MRTPAEIAHEYLVVWNEPDAAQRRRLLERWNPNSHYHDPLIQVIGCTAMAQLVSSVRERFPGMAFHLHGTPDGHGPFVRFSWMLGAESGPPVAVGTDIVRLDEDGRIAEVIGFLDEVRS